VRSVTQRLRPHRTLLLITWDAFAWLIAFYLACALRLNTVDFAFATFISDVKNLIPLYGCLSAAALAIVVHVIAMGRTRLNQGRHQVGTAEDIVALTSIVASTGLVITVLNALVSPLMLPRFVPLAATVVALFVMAVPRALWRTLDVNKRGNFAESKGERVLVLGAGEAGRSTIRAMLDDPDARWFPVALLDDDPQKQHFRYRGVHVRGTRAVLAELAERTQAVSVVIALPSASGEVLSTINHDAVAAGLKVKVLPSLRDQLGALSASDIRDLEPRDLLGRHQIETDLSGIASELEGKVVLVTGAGGSIGSELCRQIDRFMPGSLVMLDRDESALHALALTLRGRADLEAPNMVLADIRDGERMHEVFAEHRPDVVFHAAALKHVNMLENYPREAVLTNVVGTNNVLLAAERVGVKRFINISTDKAAAPENILGYTKRVAEGLTAKVGRHASGTYLSVRFGNVLGTRGSVLTTFTAQIQQGGPITVTDPEVTRFFMTVDEAVQLVIQAAIIGRDGEALVLDMGQPVKIVDVAKQMIASSGQDIDIVFTGLKPGEKLHEVLFADEENDQRPFHPLVSHVAVPEADIDSIVLARDRVAIRASLEAACADLVTADIAASI
jgi:FlaA1/EpsC-like NDP-sugar epimerase